MQASSGAGWKRSAPAYDLRVLHDVSYGS
jgi:hypothetical protein